MFHFRLSDDELNLFTWIKSSFVFCCLFFNLMKQKFQESSVLDKMLVLWMQTSEALIITPAGFSSFTLKVAELHFLR